MPKIRLALSGLFKNAIFNNSFWGILAQFSQSVFLSLIFIIIARKYTTVDFANYILVTVLFQLVIAFSTLGLSQWFVRELLNAPNKQEIVNKFFKIQFLLGIVFYLVNIALAYVLYDDEYVRFLTLIYGINVVFDNIINAVKCLDVAYGEQKKTFIILTLEALLKLLVSGLLLIYPFSITYLTIALILIRLVSLNLFLGFGTSNAISLISVIRHKIDLNDFKKLVVANWAFIVIGGLSMVNWRISTIIISKMLTITDIANYEVSYKLFSIAQILPVIISTSVFPKLIKLFGQADKTEFNAFYRSMHLFYLIFGLLSYTFIYAFGDYMLPFAFGEKYLVASGYTKEMFLTMLVFPTALLQANVLVAMHREKLDMYFNIVILIVNVTLCVGGLYIVKSLSVVNYAVFAGFIVFHICQDIVLVRNKIASAKEAIEFYLITLVAITLFVFGTQLTNAIYVFTIFWVIAGLGIMMKYRLYKSKLSGIQTN